MASTLAGAAATRRSARRQAQVAAGRRRRSLQHRHARQRRLPFQFFAPALRAFDFVTGVDQLLEVVFAFLADVLKERHSRSSGTPRNRPPSADSSWGLAFMNSTHVRRRLYISAACF